MPTLMYTESLSMVKKLGPHSWLTALKRVFRYPTKTRQCKQDEEEEKQKREKGRRWFSCKAAENKDKTAATAVAAEIISRAPPSSRLPCAATVIQTAFRCYLAKRALVALKGIVKLQALIRGQNVRRQAQITLKCMQALFRVQDRMREQCSRISHDSSRKSVFSESNNSWESKYIRERKAILRDHCSDAWRDCPPTLQELEVMLQAQNAAFMREKRLSQAWNSETDLVDGEERAKTPLKQGKTLVRNHRHKKSLCNSLVQSPATPSPAKPKPVQVRPTTSPRYLEKSHSAANTPRICPANKSTIFTPRFSTSGITPSYMAATESAKARSRSQSAPKKRPSTPDRERGALQEKSNLHFRSGGSVKRQLSYSTAIFKNGEVRMEQRSEYSCNTESVGGEISPCSTTNSSRWWSR